MVQKQVEASHFPPKKPPRLSSHPGPPLAGPEHHPHTEGPSHGRFYPTRSVIKLSQVSKKRAFRKPGLSPPAHEAAGHQSGWALCPRQWRAEAAGRPSCRRARLSCQCPLSVTQREGESSCALSVPSAGPSGLLGSRPSLMVPTGGTNFEARPSVSRQTGPTTVNQALAGWHKTAWEEPSEPQGVCT